MCIRDSSWPDSIPVKAERSPSLLNYFARIQGRNGADNIELSDQDVKYIGDGQSWQQPNNNTTFRIYDARIGGKGPNFPQAIIESTGCAIFKMESEYGGGTPNTITGLLGINDPCGVSAVNPSAFYAQIPAAIYFVTVRIQDADTFEDVVFRIDMRITITGGPDGNIRNMSFLSEGKFSPFGNTGLSFPDEKAMLPTAAPYQISGNSDQPGLNTPAIDCGFRFYGAYNKRSLFPSTLFQIKPTTPGSSNTDQGWYLYAGGFFDNSVAGWDGNPSTQNRVQPSRDLLNLSLIHISEPTRPY